MNKLKKIFEENNISEKDNYIITLETTVELLKKELNFIKNNQNISIVDYSTTNYFEIFTNLVNRLKENKDKSIQYNLISDFLYNIFDFYDFNLYLIKNEKINSVFELEENTLDFKVELMIEQGIIDWIFENKSTKIIPDLFDENTPKTTFLAVVPIIFNSQNLGFLISRVERQIDSYSQIDKELLYYIINIFVLYLIIEENQNEIKNLNLEILENSEKILENSSVELIWEMNNIFNEEISLPIKKIEGHLKILNSGLGDSKRRIELLVEEIDSLKTLLKQFNLFNKELKKKKTIQINLNKIINEIIGLLTQQFLKVNIDFEILLNQNELLVNIDKGLLEQCIITILKISRSQLSKDGYAEGGTIKIVTNNFGRYYNSITIIDNGSGFSNLDINKYNDKFRLIESVIDKKNKKEELIINEEIKKLKLLKNMLAKYKSKLLINSNYGEGTTYKIQIPKIKTF